MYRFLNCEIPGKKPVLLNFSLNWIPIDILAVVLYLFISLGFFSPNFWGTEEVVLPLLPIPEGSRCSEGLKNKVTWFWEENIHIEASKICHARKFLIYIKIEIQLHNITLNHWIKWCFNSGFINISTLRKQSQFYDKPLFIIEDVAQVYIVRKLLLI